MGLPLSKEIQRPYGQGFGDCWSVLNYFIHESVKKQEITRLSLWYTKGAGRVKRADKLTEMLPLLENSEMIQLGEREPTEPKIHWTLGYEHPLIPTLIKWKENSSKKISYQFDAKSKTEARFPSKEIEDRVLASIKLMGYEAIRVGAGMTLEECAEAMADSELFLGLDSGMAWMAGSVGVPVIFTKNNRHASLWDTNHSKKHFVLAGDYIKLLDFIKIYKRSGINHYLLSVRNGEFFRR